jgi:hypothetical protein
MVFIILQVPVIAWKWNMQLEYLMNYSQKENPIYYERPFICLNIVNWIFGMLKGKLT